VKSELVNARASCNILEIALLCAAGAINGKTCHVTVFLGRKAVDTGALYG